MAEAPNAGGGNSAQTETTQVGGAAQTDFQVPQGKALVDSTEYERLRQNNERVRGMQPYWEAGSKQGFKRAEDFEPLGKLTQVLKDRGMTLDQVHDFIAGKKAEQPEQGGAVDVAAIEKQLSEKFDGKLNSELSYRDALYEHKSAQAREDELVKKTISNLLGTSASAREKYLIERAVKHELQEKRGVYPDGHPLSPGKAGERAQFAAYDETSLGAIEAEIKKQIALGEGEDLAKLGDAANGKGKTPTPAGASGSQPPPKPTSKDTGMRPGGKPSVAAVDAAYKAIQAKRAGGAVSQR